MRWPLPTITFTIFVLLQDAQAEGGVSHRHPSSMKTLPWYSAYLACQSRDHSLYVPKSEDFSDVETLLPADGRMMWLGGRYVHTDWQWADDSGVESGVGCASITDVPLDTLSVKPLQSEEPFDCLRRCDTEFVAMQNTICICLQSRPITSLKPGHCNLRCAGNFDRSCGGSKAFSIYATYDHGMFTWDPELAELGDNCAYLHLPDRLSPSLQDVRIRTDRCGSLVSQYKMSLCQKCDTDNKTCNVSRIGEYMPWMSAEKVCRNKNNGLLLTNFRDNNTTLFELQASIPESYWIGLKREFLLKWINGSVVLIPGILSQGGFCLAAHNKTGSVTVIAVNCSTPLPYSCELNDNSVVSRETATELLASAGCDGTPGTTRSTNTIDATSEKLVPTTTTQKKEDPSPAPSLPENPSTTGSPSSTENTQKPSSSSSPGSVTPTHEQPSTSSESPTTVSSSKTPETTITDQASTTTVGQRTVPTIETELSSTTPKSTLLTAIRTSGQNTGSTLPGTPNPSETTKAIENNTDQTTTSQPDPSPESQLNSTQVTTYLSPARSITDTPDTAPATRPTSQETIPGSPDKPADDLIPLYIALGILGGILVITAIIVFTVFKWRSARRPYQDTLNRENPTERDRDDEFVFVENTGYRQTT